MTRFEANIEISSMLLTILCRFPDWRFGQALVNLKIVQNVRGEGRDFYQLQTIDPFNEEPETMLNRVKAAYQEIITQ